MDIGTAIRFSGYITVIHAQLQGLEDIDYAQLQGLEEIWQ